MQRIGSFLTAAHLHEHVPHVPQLAELEEEGRSGREASPVGTPYWMAPEVLLMYRRCTADVDAALCTAFYPPAWQPPPRRPGSVHPTPCPSLPAPHFPTPSVPPPVSSSSISFVLSSTLPPPLLPGGGAEERDHRLRHLVRGLPGGGAADRWVVCIVCCCFVLWRGAVGLGCLAVGLLAGGSCSALALRCFVLLGTAGLPLALARPGSRRPRRTPTPSWPPTYPRIYLYTPLQPPLSLPPPTLPPTCPPQALRPTTTSSPCLRCTTSFRWEGGGSALVLWSSGGGGAAVQGWGSAAVSVAGRRRYCGPRAGAALWRTFTVVAACCNLPPGFA